MKNIHLIPTENYSPLVHSTNKYGGYFLSRHYSPMREMGDSYQNIYITSDEEIKEGDWFYNTISLKPEPFKACENGDGYVNCSEYSHYRIDCKKIILTTDPKLIKDGVQAIDDEFLEWFVNNPSCEEVEVEEEDYSQKCRECGEYVKRGYICNRGCFMKSGNFIPTDKNIKYKIIIPQDEAKQRAKNYMSLKGALEPNQIKCYCGHTTYCDCSPLDEAKQETTIEEAAKEFVLSHDFSQLTNPNHLANRCFQYGAKWQKERMYSEADKIMKFLDTEIQLGLSDNKTIERIKWYFETYFEQFKKK
jgi:hypothetical protein